MKEAKENNKKSLGKSLLKVTGGILAAGVALTAITKKISDTIIENQEKKEEKDDAK